MIAEMGSLASEGRQLQWFRDAFDAVKTNYPEIKGLVFFSTSSDKNAPLRDGESPLNWAGVDRDSVLMLMPQHEHIPGLAMVLC